MSDYRELSIQIKGITQELENMQLNIQMQGGREDLIMALGTAFAQILESVTSIKDIADLTDLFLSSAEVGLMKSRNVSFPMVIPGTDPEELKRQIEGLNEEGLI